MTLNLSEGSTGSSVRHSYLATLPGKNGDIFAASLLISYCSFFISNSCHQISW